MNTNERAHVVFKFPMRRLALIALFLAVEATQVFAARTKEYDDSGLNSILRQYVHAGKVDYKALRKDKKPLAAYVENLGKVSADEYNNWSAASKRAFWINAYNAIALKQAADKYPCEAQTLFRFAFFPRYSPQNVNGFFSKRRFRIVEDFYSLELIQRLVLRVRMHDVKTLFATCPGAKGGPVLQSSLYEGPHLKEQLEDQIKRTLADPKQCRIDKAGHALYLSEFFKWFGEDFIPLMDRTFDKPTEQEKTTAVREFIMDYVSKEDAEFLKDPTIQIIYMKYDWALND